MNPNENELRRQFEDNARIMLAEQAKRERANYLEELQKIQESAPVKISLSQTIDWLISVGQAQIKSELRKTINVNEL